MTPVVVVWGILSGAAFAERPLPAYDRELVRVRWHEVNEIMESSCPFSAAERAFVCNERIDEAIQSAEAFQRQVFRDAGLTYLIGLAHRYKGSDAEAERRFRIALAMDDDYDAAWHDLGEILLKSGRLDEAREAFARVSELVDTGPNAWIGPWRLAEVAAHQHDAQAFEGHMREALRRGFSFRQIRGLPNWKRFYADPALRDSITKLVTVYSTPEVLESLQPAP